ncbi:MAG TPA: inorganic phosphate transporter, partial [Nitrospiria bacterium]
MHESIFLLALVIILALIFDASNGFHDAANAIATSVSTRVLSPRTAIVMAAVLNLIGALAGTAVAKMVGAGLVQPGGVTQLTVVSALLSAILWNLITWYFGLPTSSSHALMASIVGAGIATAGTGVVLWAGTKKVLLAIIVSPFIGFFFGFVLMILLMWICARMLPFKV